MSKTYKVPGAFFEDHMSRYWGDKSWTGYDRDTERWSGNYVHVTMTPEQFDELRDDAEFYAEGGGGFGFEYQGLMRSAAATVRWLDKQAEVQA